MLPRYTLEEIKLGADQALAERAKSQPEIIPAFKSLTNRQTSFGWEEELVGLVKR